MAFPRGANIGPALLGVDSKELISLPTGKDIIPTVAPQYSVSDYLAQLPKPDFSTVTLFEQKIAEFFGAPAAVAVDSCTHGLELCLRLKNLDSIHVPQRTYLSVPMLANKLKLGLIWDDCNWSEYYQIQMNIYDCATLWRKTSYVAGRFMCLSFQYQKHLALGRGGMILCPDEQSAATLRKMAYDGRERGIPWREQDIDCIGYHYYMTPETAALGLSKLQAAIDTPPRIWTSEDYPDISQFKVFKK